MFNRVNPGLAMMERNSQSRECIKIGVMQPFDRITWNPNQMNGQPCIRGMRLTVRRVVEAVALYPNRDDLFRNYPELEPEDLRQALAFAAANLEDTAREPTAARSASKRPAWFSIKGSRATRRRCCVNADMNAPTSVNSECRGRPIRRSSCGRCNKRPS